MPSIEMYPFLQETQDRLKNFVLSDIDSDCEDCLFDTDFQVKSFFIKCTFKIETRETNVSEIENLPTILFVQLWNRVSDDLSVCFSDLQVKLIKHCKSKVCQFICISFDTSLHL